MYFIKSNKEYRKIARRSRTPQFVTGPGLALVAFDSDSNISTQYIKGSGINTDGQIVYGRSALLAIFRNDVWDERMPNCRTVI